MTYTITIKPSDVYQTYTAHVVQELIRLDPVVDFRPPKISDRYIQSDGEVDIAYIDFKPHEPRFILSKNPVLSAAWE